MKKVGRIQVRRFGNEFGVSGSHTPWRTHRVGEISHQRRYSILATDASAYHQQQTASRYPSFCSLHVCEHNLRSCGHEGLKILWKTNLSEYRILTTSSVMEVRQRVYVVEPENSLFLKQFSSAHR